MSFRSVLPFRPTSVTPLHKMMPLGVAAPPPSMMQDIRAQETVCLTSNAMFPLMVVR